MMGGTCFTNFYSSFIQDLHSTGSPGVPLLKAEYTKKRRRIKWNRDSSPTGQFTDKHFEGSSPTELKTVHRQILYCIYMQCHNFHHLLML